MRTKTRVCAVSVVPGQLSLPLTWRALTGDLAVTIYRLRQQCWAFSSPRAMAKSSSRNGAGEQRWRSSVTKAGRFCLRIDRLPSAGRRRAAQAPVCLGRSLALHRRISMPANDLTDVVTAPLAEVKNPATHCIIADRCVSGRSGRVLCLDAARAVAGLE